MGQESALSRGRAAYARRVWDHAYGQLQLAAGQDGLDAADLEQLAIAAYLSGHSERAIGVLERLHRERVDAGDFGHAARWAVWLAILLAQRGQHAQAGGWVSRAQRLAEASVGGAARGYVLVPVALQALGNGDPALAYEQFQLAASIAEESGDADLTAMGMLGSGQALVGMGQAQRGVAMLDEAMVAVTSTDVSPIMAGIAYCAVIIACREVFDLRRAQEWTAVLSRWCRTQSGLRPYQGQCLVHRSEIMQLRGEWPEAMEEVERACAHLAAPAGDPVMGMARYQQAELLRLRGQYARAERAYREASVAGHTPQPGLALLRLAQGSLDDAVAAIRREVEATEADRVRRAHVLAADVEILLAAGDVAGAGRGVDELESVAADFDSAYLDAVAGQWRGSVLLARGRAADACVALRGAWRSWQGLSAPYDAARVRLSLAEAYQQLGDHDTAEMELDAARSVFEQLGAAPALARALELSRETGAPGPGGLTPREAEVLQLVATGATNREVADTLVISEKTVARHLSNLFAKLGVATRAAATAWAYQHGLA